MSEDFVCWDDEYSVGFEIIDNQHKELIKMTNLLFKSCSMGGTVADVALMKTIRGAVEYAQNHFHLEEKYMAQLNFPELAAHKEEHEQFVALVSQTIKEFEESKSEPLALANFLKKWLLNHIAQTDKKYAPYMAKIGKF